MYFDIACFQLVFDFPCFDFCSERFQGKRFQGMRVLRKSSFGGFIFVFFCLFIYQRSLPAPQATLLFWLKAVQRKLQVNHYCLTKCYDHPVNSLGNLNTLTSRR